MTAANPLPAVANRVSTRRLPIGAEPDARGGVHFRVWAERKRRVEVLLGEEPQERPRSVHELEPEGNGYFSGRVAEAQAGDRYLLRLDGVEAYPDPASRFQPRGPHGPSEVVDPGVFAWTDDAWPGLALEGQVIYEMHVGTFSSEGTFAAAAEQFGELAALGITAIELMPVSDFGGQFGWGYDGVNLFAPNRLYGTPNDLRRLVDRAHRAGMGAILDVVYNHLGPDGQYLDRFSDDYFSTRYQTDWGRAINFDGPRSGPVREYFLANAGYWIDEFHFDGLRLDATQSIFDASPTHILAAISRRVRQAAHGRSTLLVAENEPQHTRLVRTPEQGGLGLDALWNDDFHHSAMVVLSARSQAYYSPHRGSPQEFISAAKYGCLYQGQYYSWQNKRRGTPGFDLAPAAMVNFLQNHDQVANSARGLRCHELASPGRYRAMTALLLLIPGTPMLFQGQEFAASTPFFFFADQNPDLAPLVRQGRAEFLSQFPSIATAEIQALLADPSDRQTFERSKLDFSQRGAHAEAYALHRDLLRLRRDDHVFHNQRRGRIDGAVLGPEAFVLRYFADDGDDRLLVVNFGTDMAFQPAPEPLLAPPLDCRWTILWSSESPRYGGGGTPEVETQDGWNLLGESAVVLKPLDD